MKSDLRIPRLYKTLIALVAVLGPIYWLMFTQDGQRRTDMVLMSLLGRPAFNAALESFTDQLTEPRLRESFPALELGCSDDATPFGDRLCAAPIGSFNQYPARAVTLYFSAGQLSAVKVIYQPAYHDRIRAWVERRVGRPSPVSSARERSPSEPAPTVRAEVATFPTSGGMLLLKDGELGKADEPALLWLSKGALKATGAGASGGSS